MLAKGDMCIFQRLDDASHEFGVVENVDNDRNLVLIALPDSNTDSCWVKSGRIMKLGSVKGDTIFRCLDKLNESYIKMQLETAKMLRDKVEDLVPHQTIPDTERLSDENEDLCERMKKLSTSNGDQDRVELSGKRMDSHPREWQVGDVCVCRWCEDNKWYFAKIIDITEETGCCDVQFLYYGDEQYFIRLDRIHRVDASSWKWVEDENNAFVAQELLNTEGMKSPLMSIPRAAPELGVQSGKPDMKNRKGQSKRGSGGDEWSGGLVLSRFWRTLLLETYGNDEKAIRNLLNSWYMCGYQTGYAMAHKIGRSGGA